ncbi:TPA: hypothetical protein MYL57_005658 [Klebsiella variicola subsp. variicola]|uniref:hypothetical protein n=1 Tax=Klebsiella variicola TaxID=244366 RepID=UPI00190E7B4D|nr:hypothetical protein [Klebsiella variicola]HCB0645555.1 hypothetical protein [Klebsiella variicola subsp. variicola]
MSPETFIEKHITAALTAEGFAPSVVQGGGSRDWSITAACRSQPKKGGCFADCLYRARQWALGQATTAERKAAKKKPGRADGVHPGLF